MNQSRLLPVAVTMFLIPSLVLSQQPVGGMRNSDFKINILDGEDGVNIIKKKTAVKPVIEVRDKDNLPIAGIAVGIGIGLYAVFEDGSHTATVITNSNGIATAPNFRPLTQGRFTIQVSATYRGQTQTTFIHQTNFQTVAQAVKAGKQPGSSNNNSQANNGSQTSPPPLPVAPQPAPAASGGGHGALVVVLVIVGVAAGVGAAYAAGVLGKSDSTTTTPPVTTTTTSSLCSPAQTVVQSYQGDFTNAGCSSSTTSNSSNGPTCAAYYGEWAGALAGYCICTGGNPSPFSLASFESVAPLSIPGVSTDITTATSKCQ